MSASTVPTTANPAAGSWTPVLSGEKNINFDYPPSESLANGAIGKASGMTRNQSQDLAHVRRRSTTTNTTATQLRKRSTSEKARRKSVWRIFAKQLRSLAIVIVLVELTRRMILMSEPPSSSIKEMAVSGCESQISELDSLLKTTKKRMQVQVELLDKKIEKEARVVRQDIHTKSSALQSELKKLESRSNSLEKSIDEVNAKPWVSRDELDRIYDELKKPTIDDSALNEINIDEMRAYVRDVMEKEIEKHAADGLGRVDYALASSGAYVMDHSYPYLVGKDNHWLATSTRRAHINAKKMFSPSFGEPGQCFALKGSNGYVQIRVRGPIIPEAFTLEHVAKSVAYDRSSAPKDCRVTGWLLGKEHEKMQLLTEFTYDLDKSNVQTFSILDSSHTGPVDIIRLDFTSNHGSNSHTCIYRFRVHGRDA